MHAALLTSVGLILRPCGELSQDLPSHPAQALFGVISDVLPLGGYHKRWYIIGTSVLGGICWLVLAGVQLTPQMSALAAGIFFLCNVQVGSQPPPSTRPHTRYTVAAAGWGFASAGGLGPVWHPKLDSTNSHQMQGPNHSRDACDPIPIPRGTYLSPGYPTCWHNAHDACHHHKPPPTVTPCPLAPRLALEPPPQRLERMCSVPGMPALCPCAGAGPWSPG